MATWHSNLIVFPSGNLSASRFANFHPVIIITSYYCLHYKKQVLIDLCLFCSIFCHHNIGNPISFLAQAACRKQSHPINLRGAFAHGQNISASEATKVGFGCFHSHKAEGERNAKEASWGKTIIQNLPESFFPP